MGSRLSITFHKRGKKQQVTSQTEETTKMDSVETDLPAMSAGSTTAGATQTSMFSHRDFHTSETASYWLPKDEEEQDRLTGQHFALKELFGGNVLPIVGQHVPLDNNAKILDIGCGGGTWILDMATEYPNCDYEGVDIVDVAKSHLWPERAHFKCGNILEPLDFPDNTFDLVNMRLFVLALRETEWPLAIQEALRVTKPGGILHLTEVDYKLTGNVVVQDMIKTIHAECASRGQNPHIVTQLERILNEKGAVVLEKTEKEVSLVGDTGISKKFVWDWKHGLKSGLPVLGPKLGLHDEESQRKFLEDIISNMSSSQANTYFTAIAAQKA
ncbi:hypothetical protein EC973_005165 [Apophysomyces ossiformis]|uniref:Methyltransferase domain-containing protein n=1 Tax=Apophysomyces ossiformis TaxID=679940 RepID=A0A8H7BZK2_9FUNG|nr:hypothetical protein EC973_005165 [Apophysomyces ossiformis]